MRSRVRNTVHCFLESCPRPNSKWSGVMVGMAGGLVVVKVGMVGVQEVVAVMAVGAARAVVNSTP